MRGNTANQKFIQWIQSPTGCDGGNIDGSIWFFGIEWGGNFHQIKPPTLSVDLKHRSIEGELRRNFPNAYPYNTKITKLYAAMLGYSADQYKEVFHATNMFAKDSDTYKGNIWELSG